MSNKKPRPSDRMIRRNKLMGIDENGRMLEHPGNFRSTDARLIEAILDLQDEVKSLRASDSWKG